MCYYYCRVLFLSVVCAGSLLTQVRAADVAVSVRDNFFDPRNVTINVNDQVTWTWTGRQGHSTTARGTPPLWNSYQSSGTFSFVFSTAGIFDYYCYVIDHIGMNGSVTVQEGNTPPTVSIMSPVNNAVMSAPATFTVAANASDPAGSVSQVEFFRDTTSLGVDTISPYAAEVTNLAAGTYAISAVATDNLGAKATNSITLIVNASPTITLNSPTNGGIFAAPATVAIQASATDTDGTISQVQFFTNSASLLIDSTAPYQVAAVNLPAGSYDLFAIATDNQGATATSSVVTISVVNPAAIVLSGWRHMSATQFQFRYTADPGLRYVVERSPILTNWTGVATNTANSNTDLFTDQITTNRNFYRVGRLPNP